MRTAWRKPAGDVFPVGIGRMVEGMGGWLPPNTQDGRQHSRDSPEQSHVQFSMQLEMVRQDKGHG